MDATHIHSVSRLRRFNHGLTVAVLLVGIYIALSPLLPRLGVLLHNPAPSSAAITKANTQPATSEPIPADDILKIPRLGMTQVIHSGPSIAELSKGVWLVPNTSSPEKKSNTVIVGHRFTYAGPAVFYFLDKIEVNDRITVDWQKKEYTYKVSEIKVVPPTETSVQKATSKPQLTLYTCTPLLTAKNRLVITAPLERVRS
ncbi:MAG: sortase [Patescibacteria group bacterium]|nr:sortase [Patescibacteria group bacterium]